MQERDLWAAVSGQVTKGSHPRMWMSFLDCLELHKLTVFSAEAAKRQRFYIQQVAHKPKKATVQQHILQMGALNDFVKHLPTLKDSPKAVPTMKKGNILFGKADLAAIVLLSVLMSWQNQYTNLNHSTVPKSTRTLLPDLEVIEQVMVEKQGTKLKSKRKGSTAPSKAKGNSKRKASGGPTSQVPKKGCSKKFCQHCKAQDGPFQTHNTLDCRRYDSNIRRPNMIGSSHHSYRIVVMFRFGHSYGWSKLSQLKFKHKRTVPKLNVCSVNLICLFCSILMFVHIGLVESPFQHTCL